MSNVVNKLIFNCLVQYGNVSLPEVGSLRVEGNNPKAVFFSSKISENHIPLTDIIAEQGGISEDEAKALYNDWLTAARREDGSIYAEGVGTITPRKFDIDDELHRALNGTADVPVVTLKKRCSCGWVWWLVGGIAALGAAIYLIGNCECCNKEKCTVEAEEVVVETPAEVAPEVVEPAPAPAPVVKAPADGLRYNVMVGVFTIKYNARACAKQDPLGIGAANYLITPYPNGLWAVVAYSTNSPAKAEEMKHKFRKQQKDVWVWKRT